MRLFLFGFSSAILVLAVLLGGAAGVLGQSEQKPMILLRSEYERLGAMDIPAKRLAIFSAEGAGRALSPKRWRR